MSDLSEMQWDDFLAHIKTEHLLPPADPEQLALDQLRQRQGEQPSIVRRLPRFLVSPTARELYERVHHPKMKRAALGYHLGLGNVLLLGPRDTGKTTTAGIMVRREIAKACRDGGEAWSIVSGLYWTSALELERACKRHRDWQGHDCPEWTEAVRARLLVVDEVGWREDPKYLASVLAARFDAGGSGRTIITSGQTLAQLKSDSSYGEAVVKRMLVAGGRRSVAIECFEEKEDVQEVNNPRHPSEVD